LQAPITPEDEQGNGFIDFMTHEVELPGETLERDELARRVRATVHQMPEPLRQILMLSYFEQFPYRQISEILNIPLGTVKSRLHTAVADFAIRWKDLNKSQRTS
jgi:RNA polymerase sigma-70 factor (ECF subfamily)